MSIEVELEALEVYGVDGSRRRYIIEYSPAVNGELVTIQKDSVRMQSTIVNWIYL